MAEVEQSREEHSAAEVAGTLRVPSAGAWKWWLAGILFLATVLNYLDRQTLAICEKMIRDEFQLDDEQYGYLVAAFRWAYALMQLPAGIMADRLPLRTTFALAVGLWSLAGGAAALVLRMPMLLATRAMLGMGECFNWPCSSRIVANTFPPADRSLASGIFNSGAALGTVISPLLIGGIAMDYGLNLGWRAAFVTIGALGAVWLVIWLFATRKRNPCHAAVRSNFDFSPRGQWFFSIAFLTVGAGLPAIVILLGPRLIGPLQEAFHLPAAAWPIFWGAIAAGLLTALAWSLFRFRSRAAAFWLLITVSVTINPCWYFVNDWLIKSLREDRGLDKIKLGGVAATLVVLTIILLISDLGNLIGGGVIKLLVRRGWSLRAARGTVMFGAACVIAPVTMVGHVASIAGATALIGLAGMGITAIMAAYTACQQDLSFKRVGLTSGVIGMSANIIYAIASPAIGAYHDKHHTYHLMFILVGILPLMSVAAILAFDSVIHGGKASGPANQ